jgi:hypothetical protein
MKNLKKYFREIDCDDVRYVGSSAAARFRSNCDENYGFTNTEEVSYVIILTFK